MKIYATALLSTLASAVLAFENTVPCIMWSPKDYINGKIDSQLVMTSSDATSNIVSSFSSNVCSAKVIALFNQPEVHSNDFTRSENKDAFEQLKAYVNQASSRSEIEYITDGVDIHQIAKEIASQCDATIATLDASTVSTDDFPQQNSPIVAIVSLPASNSFQSNDALLEKVIDTIGHDNYAAVYTSTSAKVPEKVHLNRRAPVENKKLPIFAKYQLFTPGVFMVLGVTFLFLFIAGTGITWLSGIQTPIRMEAPKQKKN
ncbi:hypothetical protein G6F43_009427 [Rhizopus delemar]|nr:hypothetical protein G6F43_009427 [Rhizopus delemar]